MARRQIKWTDDRTNELLRLHRTGMSHRAIAEQMGLTQDQIENKCYNEGLTRQNPGKPDPKLKKQRRNIRAYREAKPEQFTNANPKKRRCLGGCGKMFQSSWEGERVCRRCKDLENWRATHMEDHRVISSKTGAL